jgi:hypothetical protein
MEKSFHISMDFVATMGEHFSVVSFTEVLSGWTGVRARPLRELIYVPLEAEQLDEMQKRGERYVQFGKGKPQFLQYKANTFCMHGSSVYAGVGGQSGNTPSLTRPLGNLLPTSGRVIIDPARGAALGQHATQAPDEPSHALIQLAGRYRRWINTRSNKNDASQDALLLWNDVPKELFIYCWPALVGFSFTAKAWGHVLVTGLEDIKFNDDAFNQLVLSPERKQLIRALISNAGNDDGGSSDIIGGKSGGTIILLHGPPGVGKTLTAEAIAEVLHRPLYYITMGELGLQPFEMERRLTDVLDLCAGKITTHTHARCMFISF